MKDGLNDERWLLPDVFGNLVQLGVIEGSRSRLPLDGLLISVLLAANENLHPRRDTIWRTVYAGINE